MSDSPTASYPGLMMRVHTTDEGAELGCTLCGEVVVAFEPSEAVYSPELIEKINRHLATHPSHGDDA